MSFCVNQNTVAQGKHFFFFYFHVAWIYKEELNKNYISELNVVFC